MSRMIAALLLWYALDPGLGGGHGPSRLACPARHHPWVLPLRGGRRSRDMESAEQIMPGGSRSASPHPRDRARAFSSTPVKNATAESQQRAHRLIEEQHDRRFTFLHERRMQQRNASRSSSSPPRPVDDGGSATPWRNDNMVNVRNVDGKMVWDIGNYSDMIAEVVAGSGLKDGAEAETSQSPNLGLRGGGDGDDLSMSGHMSHASQDDDEGGIQVDAASAGRTAWTRSRREDDLVAEAIELEGRRKTGREDDLLGERLWQRSSAKVKQEDDGYDVSSVESGEDGGEAGGKGRWERRRERRRRQLEKIEKEREKRGKKKAPKRPRPARDEGDAEDEAEDEQRLAGSLAAHLEGVRRGDTDSMVSAGLCYFHGRGTPIDVGYAEELLTTAAERGSARAAFNLGAMFDKGAGDVLRRNNTRAVGWFRLAAGWGHAQSQYRLGASLERQGRREEALGWYRKAAGQGVAGAVLSAGLVLVSGGAGGEGAGWGGEGEALLRKAAEGGIGRAMYELASREAGGVNPWLKRAAEAGYVPAMSRWGSALLVGEGGIPKQEPVAAEWLEKAAEGGDASAQAQIGVMYLRGFKKAICDEGFVDVKDEEKGFGWLLAAAKRGWVEAQYMLGQRYASQVELPRVLKEEAGDSGGAEEVEKYDRYAPIDPSTVGQKRRGAAKKEFQVAREKAEAWLQRAVDGGHAGACWALSRLILSSKKAGEEKGGESRRGTKGRIEERDAARRNAFSLVSRAAEGGLPEAQCEMGGIWRDGRWGLVPPNVTASTGWYLQAAMAGFPAAQLELAHALIGGVGVARDEVKAVGWLEHASRGGVLEARVELGARHMGMAARPEARERLVGESGGGGIRWDETLGEKLVRSAAEGGHTGAMVMLGRWLAGRGRAEEGAEWVVRAARAGVGEAQLEAGLKMLEAGAKDAVARSEGMRLVKEAVRNGVEGAAAKHKEWVAALGLQPKAPGGEAGSFAGAHLVEKHELHAECGRLGVKVIRAEGMPRVCSGQEWRKGVTDVGRTGAPRCSVVVGSAAGGEGEEVEGEEAVRWVSLVKRPGRAFKIKASDRFTEVEEAREQDEVSTHISWDAQCAPHWNSSFAAYLNGSKAAWTEPMRVCVYAHVSHNIGPVVIAEGSFLPWETPLKRRIRLWVDVVPEAIPQIVHSKKGRVLVELWRTRDVIPASMRQTNEAKRLAMLPPWIPMQDTHTEARDRREQAAIDMVADYIIDPTMIEMGDGTVVPYEVLDLYEHPNMFEPITGSHKDPKFLFEFFGDFHREAVRDIWTEQGPDGRWMVPNGLKVEKAQRNDDFYKWLRKFTGGRLTIDDVPPGHLNPRINGLQLRMEIKRLMWVKEQNEAKTAADAKLASEAGKKRRADRAALGKKFGNLSSYDVAEGRKDAAEEPIGRSRKGFLRSLRDTPLSRLAALPAALAVK